jgi:hypothetical protein
MGAPKPSKRDLNGYFDKDSGAIKGAKQYHHAELDFAKKLPDLITHTNQTKKVEGDMDYGHQMRPVAVVFKENVAFQGTIGGENCSLEEIAALLSLLEKRLAGHAFKLGLGKSIGMGSVSSRINKMWVRMPDSYTWDSVLISEESDRNTLLASLKKFAPEPGKALEQLLSTQEILNKIHSLNGRKQRLSFGDAGPKYWTQSSVQTIGK